MNNPYIWNSVSTSLFFGRDALLNEILSGLPGGVRCSYGVTGGRRMGKSTLLRAIEEDLTNSLLLWRESGLVVVPIYLDGLTFDRPIDPNALWKRIIKEISVALGDIKFYDVRDFADFVSTCRTLLDRSELAVRVVVLVDEIEPILVCNWADGFFANWRALLSNIPEVSESFAAVFAGARELGRLQQDMGSPLMDVLEWRSLRNLSFSDTCRLMEEPVGRTFSDAFKARVFEHTGGQPMLVQYVMHHVVARNVFDQVDDVDKIANQFISSRGWQFGDWWNKNCSSSARRVYRRLGDINNATSLRDLVLEFGIGPANEGVEVLQHVGIGLMDEETLEAKKLGKMFATWHMRFGSSSDAETHDEKIASKLRELNPDLMAKYVSAWRILGSDMPNYSGAVSELRDTVTLVLHSVAPDDKVMAGPGFQLEKGQTRPTRKQRAKYAAKVNLLSSDFAKALISELELLESHCEQVAIFVSAGYSASSALTHTTATRDACHMALRQADSILAQILPQSATNGTG